MADILSGPDPDHRESHILRMRLQMSEEFVDKLRRQLQESEDQLQIARRTYYSVVIGGLYNFSWSPIIILIQFYR